MAEQMSEEAIAALQAEKRARDTLRAERWAQLDRERRREMLAAGGLADIALRGGRVFPG